MDGRWSDRQLTARGDHGNRWCIAAWRGTAAGYMHSLSAQNELVVLHGGFFALNEGCPHLVLSIGGRTDGKALEQRRRLGAGFNVEVNGSPMSGAPSRRTSSFTVAGACDLGSVCARKKPTPCARPPATRHIGSAARAGHCATTNRVRCSNCQPARLHALPSGRSARARTGNRKPRKSAVGPRLCRCCCQESRSQGHTCPAGPQNCVRKK